MKNLLILRNETALVNTNEFFKVKGVDFFSCPISFSNSIEFNLEDLKSDIYLVTSQNAYQAVVNNKDFFKDKEIYCLNKHISQKLKDFNLVSQSWNNTSELAEYIIKNEASAKSITHLCADNANKLFYKPIEKAGFKINAIDVYKTTFADSLNDEVLNALKSEEIKYIMIFSKASLKCLEQLFKQYNLDLENYKLICFSKRIAEGHSGYYVLNSKLDDMLDLYLNL